MVRSKPLRTSVLILLSMFLAAPLTSAEIPAGHKLEGVPRVKQLYNYCGPATLSAILQYYGEKITQEAVGKVVYDSLSGATNGADMLLYARDKGFSAYSWNATLGDVKRVLATGVPVIVLQQNSQKDTSGHYRVLTGYDDSKSSFHVMDPYYDDVTEMSYTECDKLWSRMGHWALLVVPPDRDKFKAEFEARNPVVHMDLSYAQYRRKNYDDALKEANVALELEPGNTFALSMVDKIQKAMQLDTAPTSMGAGSR